MKRQICTALLALALCTGPMLPAAHAEEGAKILSVTAHQAAEGTYLQLKADGEEIPLSDLKGGQPFVDENDRAQVPLRKFAEAVGGTADWDNETRQVTVRLGEDVITLTVGENALTKNGNRMELDTAAQIIDGSTYIPLRAAAEALGYTVEYSQRQAVYASLRLDRENIASAHCQANITGASAPVISLDESQTDQLYELLNRACMTSEWKETDFSQDTVRSYSGTGSVTLKDRGHVLLMCRGENEVRYDRFGQDGNFMDQFLLTDHALCSFLKNIMYSNRS